MSLQKHHGGFGILCCGLIDWIPSLRWIGFIHYYLLHLTVSNIFICEKNAYLQVGDVQLYSIIRNVLLEGTVFLITVKNLYFWKVGVYLSTTEYILQKRFLTDGRYDYCSCQNKWARRAEAQQARSKTQNLS